MKGANPEHLGRHVVVRIASLHENIEDSQFQDILNEQDRTRAARFRFPEDRARFIGGRMLLLASLREMGVNPALPLRLIPTSKGRPIFENSSIEFNLSHSGSLIAVALSLKTSVGIDLELVSRQVQLDSLAEKIFSTHDLNAFRQIPRHDARQAFFRAWTGKEAILKAQGLGLVEGLKAISIPLEPGDFSSPKFIAPEGGKGTPWCLQALPLPEGYLGHVAWNDPEKCLDSRVLNPTAG